MKKCGWLVVLFLSFNGYSYLGEEVSGGDQCDAGSIEAQILDAIENLKELVTTTNSSLINCFSDSMHINNNVTSTFSGATECLEHKLQNVETQICQTKRDLYTKIQQQKNDDQSSRQRVQFGMTLIEDLHVDHRTVLLKRSDYWEELFDNNVGNVLWAAELKAYSEIFKTNAAISCPAGE
ncbi:MAG: hypothetical protein OXK80_05475 [Bdellovibrionales bacterium]|nr:hypothetical protein [Bdellovibrionales bacterium]